MKGWNIIGLKTLYIKEVMRFLKVYNQTLFAPVVTALLFLAVFSLAVGERISSIGNVPFELFITAGLIIMSVVQNAFANTSSSIVMGKVLGNIIDYLMPPISASEIIIAMTGAAITRGLAVGILVALAVWCFTPYTIHNPTIALFYLVTASALLGLLGIISGILSETFDHMAAITSYIITPLAFLSGTFYSIHNLPPLWYTISQYNPFFYMIDGFRYGLTGYADGSLTIGTTYLFTTIVGLWITSHFMISKGYRIKS